MKYASFIFSTCVVIFLGYCLARALEIYWKPELPPDLTTTENSPYHYHLRLPDGQVVSFNLLDPEQAPPQIHAEVMLGACIVDRTKEYVPDHVGNHLSCTNCHFCTGGTLGGWNGGISLVGVTACYPEFNQRAGKVIDLADRLNNCFVRSMNGSALAPESREIQSIIAYLQWISSEVADLKNLPWRGLKPIMSQHVPDPVAGEQVYRQNCSICHQPDGSGTQGTPPLWGPYSFNDGAGMNKIELLAPFIYANMPYQMATQTLTEDQALDVAAFVIKQPRPHCDLSKLKR
jgi:thiosulfate dehydrogenase